MMNRIGVVHPAAKGSFVADIPFYCEQVFTRKTTAFLLFDTNTDIRLIYIRMLTMPPFSTQKHIFSAISI